MTTLNTPEMGRCVLTFVLNRPLFRLVFDDFAYEKRRGRESNPRIAVLQTATLPLGYPAVLPSEMAFSPMKTTPLSIDSL
jgi:hypothetical protein